MLVNGFVKMPREIAGRSWFGDGTTLKVYVFLLCSAVFKDIARDGFIIRKGQYITSIRELSGKCQLSIQQTRTVLKHLKATNDITIQASPSFSIITVKALAGGDGLNTPVNTLANTPADTQSNTISRSKEEVKEKIKEEEVRTASPLARTFGKEDISFADPESFAEHEDEQCLELIREYGKATVISYEKKFRSWAAGKKTVNAAMYPTITKWMAQDIRVKSGNVSTNDDEVSSIDIEEFERAVMRQYLK